MQYDGHLQIITVCSQIPVDSMQYHLQRNTGIKGKAEAPLVAIAEYQRQEVCHAMMRFCNVTPLIFNGWKSFGGGEPLGCGSDAVPAGGF